MSKRPEFTTIIRISDNKKEAEKQKEMEEKMKKRALEREKDRLALQSFLKSIEKEKIPEKKAADRLNECADCHQMTSQKDLFICCHSKCYGASEYQSAGYDYPSEFFANEKLFCSKCAYFGKHEEHDNYIYNATDIALNCCSTNKTLCDKFYNMELLNLDQPIDYAIREKYDITILPELDARGYLTSTEEIGQWEEKRKVINKVMYGVDRCRQMTADHIRENAEKVTKLAESLAGHINASILEDEQEELKKVVEEKRKSFGKCHRRYSSPVSSRSSLSSISSTYSYDHSSFDEEDPNDSLHMECGQSAYDYPNSKRYEGPLDLINHDSNVHHIELKTEITSIPNQFSYETLPERIIPVLVEDPDESIDRITQIEIPIKKEPMTSSPPKQKPVPLMSMLLESNGFSSSSSDLPISKMISRNLSLLYDQVRDDMLIETALQLVSDKLIEYSGSDEQKMEAARLFREMNNVALYYPPQ